MRFFERLAGINTAQGHQICAGIDLHMQSSTWQSLLKKHGAEELIFRCCVAVVEASVKNIKSFKLQSAFFEAHGSAGILALKRTCDFIHKQGGVVILDAKRGDISSTMSAYGQMAFDFVGADALTVLPYMGISTLDALKPWLKDRGIYVVWVSSNPDGVIWQNPVQSRILNDCTSWMERERATGSLGFVLGATKLEDLPVGDWNSARSQSLLLPGFGAQGAKLTQRHRDIGVHSPASLFPVSRALCDFDALVQENLGTFTAEVSRTTALNTQNLINQFSFSGVSKGGG